MATFAFNTKVNSSTGVTPFEAWMGRPAKLPIDLVIPTPDQQWVNTDAYIQETLMRFREMYAFMQKHTEATFRRNARLYAGKTNVYQVDDLIWVFSKRKVPGKPNKITDGWTGPYRYCRSIAGGDPSWGRRTHIHHTCGQGSTSSW